MKRKIILVLMILVMVITSISTFANSLNQVEEMNLSETILDEVTTEEEVLNERIPSEILSEGDVLDKLLLDELDLFNHIDMESSNGRGLVIFDEQVLSTLSGDFNGDGNADIVVIYDYGGGQTNVIVWLGSGTSFSSGKIWYDSGPNGLNPNLIKGRIVSGDFTNDGRADIAMIYDCGNALSQLYVLVSTGTSFTRQLWADTGIGNCEAGRLIGRVVAGDFNGDGKRDIAGMYRYDNEEMGIIVWKGQLTTFNNFEIWHKSGAWQCDATRFTGRVVASDFDGDGKHDVAGLYDYGNEDTGILVYKSQGTSFSNFATWYRSGAWQCDANRLTDKVVAGDFNGDSKFEVIGMYRYPGESFKALMWTSQTNKFSNFQIVYNLGATFTNAQITGRMFIGKFTNSNKYDVGVLANKGIYVYTSTGTGLNSPAYQQNTVLHATPQGYLDEVNNSLIRGWAWRSDLPNTPIEVHIYLTNINTGQTMFHASTMANLYRSDLLSAGIGNGYHAFDTSINWNNYPTGTYAIVVYGIGKNGENPALTQSPKYYTSPKPYTAFSVGSNWSRFY